MLYRKLGRTGLDVSAVGLGSWLTFGVALDDAATRACVHRAFELGVTLFDTANEYGQGAAEESLGRALSQLPRSAVVVASKVYWPMGEAPTEWGLSRKHIFDQCEASIRRLGLGHIDLYQCHRFDSQRPIEETCRAMNDLVRQGKILYWGVSEWPSTRLVEALLLCRDRGWDPPVSNQVLYNPLWRTIETSALPVADALGMGTIAFGPLAMGVLTGKYTSVDHVPPDSRGAGPAFAYFTEDDTWRDFPWFTQETLDAVQRLLPIADRAGCSPAQLALAWCLRQSPVSSVLVGATKVAHVEDNVVAGELQLDPAVLTEVSETLREVADFDAPTAPNMDE
jgi:voltage-dependent potassium channel beta subunit